MKSRRRRTARSRWRRLRLNSHSLVISDAMMPEKGGLELLRDVQREFGDLPVVIVSGGSDGSGGDVWKTAEQLGARAVLRKPVDIKDFLQTVRDVLDEPRPEGPRL